MEAITAFLGFIIAVVAWWSISNRLSRIARATEATVAESKAVREAVNYLGEWLSKEATLRRVERQGRQ